MVLVVPCSAPSEMLAGPQIKSRQTRKRVTLQFLVVKRLEGGRLGAPNHILGDALAWLWGGKDGSWINVWL